MSNLDYKRKQIDGRGIPVTGNDIDTDRIIPARFRKEVTFESMGQHAFEDARKANPEHPFNQPAYQGASVLVVGQNFGCGSSREHAPQADLEWLQKQIERNPKELVRVDVEKQEVRFGDRVIQARIPDGPRNQLVQGTYDSTRVRNRASAVVAPPSFRRRGTRVPSRSPSEHARRPGTSRLRSRAR